MHADVTGKRVRQELPIKQYTDEVMNMLWFNFLLGLNFIFFCFWVW